MIYVVVLAAGWALYERKLRMDAKRTHLEQIVEMQATLSDALTTLDATLD